MYKLEVYIKNMKKLYEYVIDNQLNYQFIKRISINEQTKTVWFELIVINTITNEEDWLIKDTVDLNYEKTSQKIKDFLLTIIEVKIANFLNWDYEIEQIDNGFKINGKEFLLECDKYAELKQKVLNEVKNGLH